ncbi:MAG TPA: hypothetical protein VLA52_14080 [Thermohalobaculum sp.]|nr:hypothetical protein [Thermohalobaculum sp.]
MTLPVVIHGELRIERSLADRIRSKFRATGHARAVVDGRPHACLRGAWATWIPALGAKFMNSVDGRLGCLHRNAPARQAVLQGEGVPAGETYTAAIWRQAYETTVSRRVAENVIAAQRLHAAGLGPRVLGLCIALRYRDGARLDQSFAAGFLSEDVLTLPTKPPATMEQFLAAGVAIDRIGSAVRQQVNGYVIDLNAAIGVTPLDAEDEVAELAARIDAEAAAARKQG